MVPVVSARRLCIRGSNDGPGAPDVEVCLIVGVHDGVLLVGEPRVRSVPVIVVAVATDGPRVGDIVRVETPGDAPGGHGDPATSGLGTGSLGGSTVVLVDVGDVTMVFLTQGGCHKKSTNDVEHHLCVSGSPNCSVLRNAGDKTEEDDVSREYGKP